MRSFLTIGVETSPGYQPISYFRGQNVGVGGKHLFCPIAPGEPVRRATQSELRRLDRWRIVQLLAKHPGGRIVIRRTHQR